MTLPSSSPSAPTPQGLMVLPLPDGPRVVVVVAGEGDLSNATLMRDLLIEGAAYGPHAVVIDATGLTFCDLRGLDALTEAVEAVAKSGVDVTLRPSVHLTRLAATLDQATQSVGSLARTA